MQFTGLDKVIETGVNALLPLNPCHSRKRIRNDLDGRPIAVDVNFNLAIGELLFKS